MKNIRNITTNGVKIPNECDCLWCGGKMERRGVTRLGSGVNTFALWCSSCGAVVIHAHEYNRKIDSFEITFKMEE